MSLIDLPVFSSGFRLTTPVKIPAIIKEIIQHTSDVKTFIIKPVKPCPNFKPGQFLHLALDEYDPSFNWPESRVFSIANSPTRRFNLKITFSVKGKFTSRMFNEVNIGDKVWIKLPYGSFSFPEDQKKLVLIAGGTGMTPFISFLEYAIDKEMDNQIFLYYGVRTPNHVIFSHLLKECQRKLTHFKLYLFIEEGPDFNEFERVSKGILPIQYILDNTRASDNILFYLSGPPQMNHSFKQSMIQRGIATEKIKVDEWQ
jgi:NAD(P)H-flavin reductase